MEAVIGRRERKRLQTADLLAETAFALFEEHGYEAVTMEQIAATADVAKGTLYNHFPVKEALLRHYFHLQIVEQAPVLEAELAALDDTIERLVRLLQHAADWAERHRRYWPYYLHYRLSMRLDDTRNERSGLDAVFIRLIGDAQQAGRLRRDRDTVELVHYFRFLYLGAMTRWIAVPDRSLMEEYRNMLDLFLAGAGQEAS